MEQLIGLFRREGWLVVHTREGHKPDLSDCPKAKRERGNPTLRIGDSGPMGRILIHGEDGHDIIPELRPIAGRTADRQAGQGILLRHAAWRGARAKRGITHLIFAGVTTEVCVQTTMREANDRGYTCLLIEDATESYFPEFKAATLAMIRAQGGIVGWTAPLSALEAAVAAEEAA